MLLARSGTTTSTSEEAGEAKQAKLPGVGMMVKAMTLSYDQVRLPIYSSSIGRWRRFERHLGPLQEALAENG